MATPNLLNLNLNQSEIEQYTQKIIDQTNQIFDKIAKIPNESRSWANTVGAFEDAEGSLSTLSANVYFPSYISINKEIRDASSLGKKKINDFSIDTYTREDLYQAISSYKKKGEKLDPVDQRLVDKILEDFERQGLGLPSEKRETLKEIKKKISELSIKATQNMNEECSKYFFTEEELKGVPADFLAKLPRNESGQCIVTLKYPDYVPIQQYCQVVETRKTLEKAYNSRCQDQNTTLLEELIKLRDQAARFLGFPNHAAYVLAVRMAKTPETVTKFLDDLIEMLQPALNSDIEKLLELKKQDCEEKGLPNDGLIQSWDYQYLMNLLLEKEYKINENEIKQYFPFTHVTKALMDVYQELLGLKFVQIENPTVWHPDVQLFEVFNESDGKFVGQFYLDMFPRDGKYTHAAVFGLQKARECADGTWQHPAVAMVCNFNKPTPEQPSLLYHNNVVTFFHEMGHVFHQICSTAKYNRFSGTSVERDFVEAPSQMLENWCWEKSILRRISKHHETGEPLPDELLSKMIKSKLANVGLLNCRQLFFGKYDMLIHTNPNPGDLAQLYGTMRTKITGVQNTPGTNGAAAWGHIFGGYDASYYGYMWSEVYSCDMFSLFKENPMDKALGKRYRECILEKGGTIDGIDLLKQFLGRDPTVTAFLEQKGITKK